MKHLRATAAASTAIAAVLLLSSCATNEGQVSDPTGDTTQGAGGGSLSGTLNGVGATSQSSAQDAWRAAFQTANGGVTVNYDPQGSGAGRTAFINGGADFAGSDSFLDEEELGGEFAACAAGSKAVDIPVYISPIAIPYNVEGVDELKLDAETAAGIFAGKITRWNDAAIAALNEGVTLPDATITVVRRSDDSGTTENFTQYLAAAAPDVWTEEASDTWPFNNGDGANGTSGVIDAVTNGTNTIGYADFSRVGQLSTASIKIGEEFVAPSAEGASNAVANSPKVEGREADDLAVEINRTTTSADEYPIALISYAIACTDYADDAKGSLVKAYLQYLTSEEGQQTAATEAGSAPLSGSLATDVARVVGAIE